MTALDKIKEITVFLQGCDVEDAHKESEIILRHCLGIDKAALYRDNPVLSEENVKDMDAILQRRAKREPLQYILGYVEFYGLKIKVGKGVLIPRPETEFLVEEILKALNSQLPALSKKELRILDLCTGSGCLALALAKNFPDAKVYGTDISATAIRYAKENAELNGISNAVFLKGSLYEPLKQLISETSLKFDVIVSNPPYIRSNDIPDLQPEISRWEPKNALDGGEDGLRYYRDILSEARKYLMPDGIIFLEAGEGQAGDVSGIACSNHFRRVSVIKDYAGIDRLLTIAR
ncbi:MAG: peptide chain release factor N(5)-glutamine methyltransferase [Nitrospirae bacterium]|nr:MAG: peptide chain release factor N(5)-glutamine methyltransferase [Nitrospirota bacterium]